MLIAKYNSEHGIVIFQKVTIEAPQGHVLGYVTQAWSICKPRYKIQNASEETLLRVKGPCCTWNLCGDIEFDVSG